MMKRFFFFLLLFVVSCHVSAKFEQEIELVDGTILVGYVYQQQPGKKLIVHVEKTREDKRARFLTKNKDYTISWKELKYIRRLLESEHPWCQDRITLKNGTQYTGRIIQQEVGKTITILCDTVASEIAIPQEELEMTEKINNSIDHDLWLDRPYTNRLVMTDNTVREGLVVLQYYGEKKGDGYLELLHSKGYRERIYLLDIIKYEIQLK